MDDTHNRERERRRMVYENHRVGSNHVTAGFHVHRPTVNLRQRSIQGIDGDYLDGELANPDQKAIVITATQIEGEGVAGLDTEATNLCCHHTHRRLSFAADTVPPSMYVS